MSAQGAGVRPGAVSGRGTPAPAASTPEGVRYKFVAAGVVMVGAVMVILDQTVVTVALPTLETDFSVSLADVQWIITAYTLALAAVIPLTGWLTDRYGTRRVFVTSQILFVAGSVLCGLSWSNASLIGFRILQGLGGGMIMPVGMTILMSITRPEERGRMGAVMGVPMLFGPVAGPTVGGWLVQDASWRYIFFINLPIGLIGAFLSMTQLREPADRVVRRERLDIVGLLLVTPAVLGLVYGLSQPGSYGWWSLETMGPLLGGLALLVAFVVFELRKTNPLIDIRVFRDGAFSASMSMNFLIAMGLFGTIFLFPLFLQQIQGYSPLNAGLLLGFQGLGSAAAMPVAGILTDRVGARRVVPIGLTLLTGATVWMTTLTPTTPGWTIALMLAIRGCGMGFSFMPSMSAAYVTLAPAKIARATSVANVVQRVASGLGIAIMASVLTSRISANLPALPRGTAVSTGANLAAAHLPPGIKTILLDQAAKGFDDAFWVGAGLVVMAFPMTLLLRRALDPAVVRSYGVRQASEGIVLGVAALQLRDGRLNGAGAAAGIDRAEAFRVLAAGAMARLQRGLTVLKMGTNAAGLVPQPGVSRARRTSFGFLLAFALVLCVAAVVRGYQPPQVPGLPSPASRPPAAASAPAQAPTGGVQVGVQVVNAPPGHR
ncbi:MAG: DHA2 family efflux MFS transporter permease subunit [Candidatus Dormibacteraeota bacterium]|nr:DHA2 family efflux MFS transporter permease subunit [Candidatus Dormibacteraeota bacterium]